MTYEYTPVGVCSKRFIIEIDDNGRIAHAEVWGGCHGNLQGICRLIEGRKADEVISTLEGIRCGLLPRPDSPGPESHNQPQGVSPVEERWREYS